jgi:hypothetical protein
LYKTNIDLNNLAVLLNRSAILITINILKLGPNYILQSLANKHGDPVTFAASGSGDAANLYLGSSLHLLQVVIHLLEET